MLRFFGSQSEIARAFGVSRQAVSKWVLGGRLPVLRAYQAQVLMQKKR